MLFDMMLQCKMIELRKVQTHACISRARDLVSARGLVSGGAGGAGGGVFAR